MIPFSLEQYTSFSCPYCHHKFSRNPSNLYEYAAFKCSTCSLQNDVLVKLCFNPFFILPTIPVSKCTLNQVIISNFTWEYQRNTSSVDSTHILYQTQQRSIVHDLSGKLDGYLLEPTDLNKIDKILLLL